MKLNVVFQDQTTIMTRINDALPHSAVRQSATQRTEGQVHSEQLLRRCKLKALLAHGREHTIVGEALNVDVLPIDARKSNCIAQTDFFQLPLSVTPSVRTPVQVDCVHRIEWIMG